MEGYSKAKRFLALGLFLLNAALISAQSVVYVSPAGDDEHGDGSASRPYASLQKAYTKTLSLHGKDTLYIRMAAGRYELNRTVTLRQSPKVPVVVEGATEGRTVFSGGIRVTDWKVGPYGWWTAHIPEVALYGRNIEQFYVNGERAIRARTPDKGAFVLQGSKEWLLFGGSNRTSPFAVQRFSVTPQQLRSLLGQGYEANCEIVANFHHKWSVTRRKLCKAVADSGYVFTAGAPLQRLNMITKGSRLILENYKNALSQPGEWFLEKDGTMYYIPRKGEKIEEIEAYAPVLEQLLTIEGTSQTTVEHITFRGIVFEHAAYMMPNTGNAPIQAAAVLCAAIRLKNANHIRFENCVVRHTGSYAFHFGENTKDCSLEHSLLKDLGAGGVKIGEFSLPRQESAVTRRISVVNNIIQQTGRVFPSAVGVVIFHSSDNRVIHNEFSDMMYSAISVGWTWGYDNSYAVNNEIAYNHIHHIGWGVLSDMGGIYTLGPSPGTRIHHNVIHDICSYDYGGWGLYTDEGSSDIVLENNLVYRCKSGAFHQHYGKNNIVRNNIFAFSSLQQLQLTKAEKHRSFVFSNNIILGNRGQLFYGQWEKAQVEMRNNMYWYLDGQRPQVFGKTVETWMKEKEHRSYWMNPGFVDPLHDNFHFQNKTALKKIDFHPFDYEKAGVYGSEEWKKQAELPEAVKKQFEKLMNP